MRPSPRMPHADPGQTARRGSPRHHHDCHHTNTTWPPDLATSWLVIHYTVATGQSSIRPWHRVTMLLAGPEGSVHGTSDPLCPWPRLEQPPCPPAPPEPPPTGRKRSYSPHRQSARQRRQALLHHHARRSHPPPPRALHMSGVDWCALPTPEQQRAFRLDTPPDHSHDSTLKAATCHIVSR
jgi:hypothetical protein